MTNLERERLNRNWKLSYVAKQVGTTESTVCDWEKRRSKPSYERLVKLENLFGKTHRELFEPADKTESKT